MIDKDCDELKVLLNRHKQPDIFILFHIQIKIQYLHWQPAQNPFNKQRVTEYKGFCRHVESFCCRVFIFAV